VKCTSLRGKNDTSTCLDEARAGWRRPHAVKGTSSPHSVKWYAIRVPLHLRPTRNRPSVRWFARFPKQPGLQRDDNGRRDVTTCVAFASRVRPLLAPRYIVGHHRMGYHLAARRRYTTNRLSIGQQWTPPPARFVLTWTPARTLVASSSPFEITT